MRKSNNIDVNTIWDKVRASLPMYFGTVLLYWLLLIATYALVIIAIVGAAVISGCWPF